MVTAGGQVKSLVWGDAGMAKKKKKKKRNGGMLEWDQNSEDKATAEKRCTVVISVCLSSI